MGTPPQFDLPWCWSVEEVEYRLGWWSRLLVLLTGRISLRISR